MVKFENFVWIMVSVPFNSVLGVLDNASKNVKIFTVLLQMANQHGVDNDLTRVWSMSDRCRSERLCYLSVISMDNFDAAVDSIISDSLNQ